MRRYANTTTQASNLMTGVVYRPYAGSPSLSLGPIQGITALPFSRLLGTPAGVPAASSTEPSTHSEASLSIASSAASFQYQPLQSSSADHAGAPSKTYNSQNSGIPTSFWTFGNQEFGSTVTVTSTTYETVWAAPQGGDAASAQESRSSGVHNTTTTSAQRSSRTFVFDPLTTPPDSDSAATTETAVTTTASDSYRSPLPFPTTTPSGLPSQQTDHSESTNESSSSSSTKLPEVVTEGTPTTQSQAEVGASESTVVPGITIVPQNPSVIYITVTDAGATTTVTA